MKDNKHEDAIRILNFEIDDYKTFLVEGTSTSKDMQEVFKNDIAKLQSTIDLLEGELLDMAKRVIENDKGKGKMKEWKKQFNKRFCMSEDGAFGVSYLFRVNPDGSLSIALLEDVEVFISELKNDQDILVGTLADKIKELEIRNEILRMASNGWQKLNGDLKEALIWCSGSTDFGPGGKAETGWNKTCRPLLKEPK